MVDLIPWKSAHSIIPLIQARRRTKHKKNCLNAFQPQHWTLQITDISEHLSIRHACLNLLEFTSPLLSQTGLKERQPTKVSHDHYSRNRNTESPTEMTYFFWWSVGLLWRDKVKGKDFIKSMIRMWGLWWIKRTSSHPWNASPSDRWTGAAAAFSSSSGGFLWMGHWRASHPEWMGEKKSV